MNAKNKKEASLKYVYISNRHIFPGFGLLKPNQVVSAQTAEQKESVKKYWAYFMSIEGADKLKKLFNWDDYSQLTDFVQKDTDTANAMIIKAEKKLKAKGGTNERKN